MIHNRRALFYPEPQLRHVHLTGLEMLQRQRVSPLVPHDNLLVALSRTRLPKRRLGCQCFHSLRKLRLGRSVPVLPRLRHAELVRVHRLGLELRAQELLGSNLVPHTRLVPHFDGVCRLYGHGDRRDRFGSRGDTNHRLHAPARHLAPRPCCSHCHQMSAPLPLSAHLLLFHLLALEGRSLLLPLSQLVDLSRPLVLAPRPLGVLLVAFHFGLLTFPRSCIRPAPLLTGVHLGGRAQVRHPHSRLHSPQHCAVPHSGCRIILVILLADAKHLFDLAL